MSEQILAAWRVLPEYLSQHIVLSALALFTGVAISLPLIVLALHRPRLRWLLLATASLIQTIPSLALLALFYPLLLGLAALAEHWFGHGFSALGFLPSLLALTLYSMLPIIRNGVVGVLGIDAAVIEAAKGVGMTNRQRLFLVELPLAAPVIMAGVRTAAVWVIGAATLSTPVGQTSLGNYIFSGLQLENWVSVLFGCVASAVLALAVDQILGLIETATARRSRTRLVIGMSLLVAVLIGALAASGGSARADYTIGAKNFSEQYTLAALMAARLEAQGARVTQRVGLGSVIAFRALASGELDAYVDYSGTIWANVMGRTDVLPPREVLAAEREWLLRERGVVLLGSLGFENAYALAMRRDTAERLGIRSIADLAIHAPTLRVGSDLEFFGRPEWAALRDRYGLAFAAQRQFQSTFMYKALVTGEVDVISAFSSDGRIAANDLVVLEDPAQVVLPYDAILLVTASRARDPRLCRALAPLLNAIGIEQMRLANLMVDRDADKQTPVQAAAWLAGQARLRPGQVPCDVTSAD
jgi:osmoprotectant transport system permease protein